LVLEKTGTVFNNRKDQDQERERQVKGSVAASFEQPLPTHNVVKQVKKNDFGKKTTTGQKKTLSTSKGGHVFFWMGQICQRKEHSISGPALGGRGASPFADSLPSTTIIVSY
jgi:hypothetical protein